LREIGLRGVIGIAIIAVVLVAAAWVLISPSGSVYLPNPPSKYAVNGRSFPITFIATDSSARARGLMNTKITNSTSMLFVFPSYGAYGFWMSNVNASLDMIWLNVTGSVGHVVYLALDVPGCSSPLYCQVYQPDSNVKANWVLETHGGFASSQNMEVGTTIVFS
jgi:uncharacterized protein